MTLTHLTPDPDILCDECAARTPATWELLLRVMFVRLCDACMAGLWQCYFPFPQGATVRWAEDPYHPYLVLQQRYTTREVLGPLTEYRIILRSTPVEGIAQWVTETEITAWDEEKP